MTIDLRKPQYHAPARPARGNEMVHTHADAPIAAHRPHSRVPKRRQERAVMLFAAGAIILIVLVLVGYGVSQAWQHFFHGSDYEVRSLVSDVGAHMLLPEGETPTLATVTDMHALEGQAFFKNAQEGDKVLMYLQAQKAILYRPSIDKIIEVGPITGAAQ